MVANFQLMIKDMMKDMFQQITLQMESLLRTLIPMIQNPPAPQQTQPFHGQMYHPIPTPNNTQQSPAYQSMMYQGGHQSTVAPAAS